MHIQEEQIQMEDIKTIKISGNEKYQESEIKSMEWMTYEDAINTITYDNTRELFKRILKEEKL